ncbi:MAG: hypothetical protein R2780_00435 [Crocinitomicaceae bacterium]|nr:hypothetical protein [Crocinitomicaceae bacterium]
MRLALGIVAIIVCAYIVIFMNAVMVYSANIPQEINNHFLGSAGIKVAVFSIFLVVPAHAILVYTAVKKKEIDWILALPYFTIPYMLGASIQAIVL